MKEEKANEILRTVLIVTVIGCILGASFWGFKELLNHGHEVRGEDHEITQEEAKEKILEEFSKVLQETPKSLREHLPFFANKTTYLEVKNASVGEVLEFVEKELKRNNREIYSSLPKTSEELQEGIGGASYRKKLLLNSIFLPRLDGNKGSIDWKKALEMKEKNAKKDKEKIKKDIKEVKKIIQDDYNVRIKSQVQELVDANNLSEINKWMNKYLDTIIIGSFLLEDRDKASSKIGERLTHSLVEYQTVVNQKTGFSMQIHTFSC